VTDFPFKRGKLPAVNTLRSMRSAIAMAAMLDPLGTPPTASNNYVAAVSSVAPNVYDNDRYGNCVEVDTAYGVILRTVNAQAATVIPTLTDVLSLYEVFGFDPHSGKDPGTSESAMCWYLQNHGFLGHKLDIFTNLDPANINHMKWSIQLFGGCRVGWALPNYAEQQFLYRQPWDVIRGADQSSSGGHDTRLVHYEGDTFYAATWGRWLQPVTIPFINMFCEEAHPELYFDWIKEQGLSPSGLDLATLEQKLKEAAA
jgi:hypothetical protein